MIAIPDCRQRIADLTSRRQTQARSSGLDSLLIPIAMEIGQILTGADGAQAGGRLLGFRPQVVPGRIVVRDV